MKKWLCLVLAGMLLLCCTACNGEPSPSQDASSPATREETEFTVSQGTFTYTVTGTPGEETKTLTVTDKASGKALQTIRFTENEWFTKDPLYLADVTFDGHADLLVPLSRPASGAFFRAYVWDAETGQYWHAPSFETLPNVATDAATGTLLSHRTADKITAYGMYQYSPEKHDFISLRSLYWEPQGDGQSMRVTQTDYTADGTEQQTRQFSVPAAYVLGVDKTDAQMAPYFAGGSLWDLDSEKWNSPVIPAGEYTY